MSESNNKIDAILADINKDIESHAAIADEAFATLEKMNITPEEYKDANWAFGLNHFVAGYLRHFRNDIVEHKIAPKTLENRMRFHAYGQRTKGELGDEAEISAAQLKVAELLEGYVQKYFED